MSSLVSTSFCYWSRVRAEETNGEQRSFFLAGHKISSWVTGLAFLSANLGAIEVMGMAGNVTAFNTVWTYDIYQSYLAKNKSDEHYLWMGHMATGFGIFVSIGTAYLAMGFPSIMDYMQLIFGSGDICLM
jgi:Na+/proline symporter